MDGGRTVLVTVVGPGGRRDLALPADSRVRELIPPLIDLAGDARGRTGALEWTLSAGAGRDLRPDETLAEGGIPDGAVLYLSPAREPAAAPSPGAPPGPIERTRALLPERLSPWGRLGEALAAALSSVAERPQPPGAFVRPGGGDHPRPTPAALTAVHHLSAWERARRAWVDGGYLRRLHAAVVAPRLRRCVTIAVVSPKGGVGKTTITALLGMLLADLRRDRVVAVDTNPDYGSLGRVLAPDAETFVDDLVAPLERDGLSVTGLDALLGRASHGLMVVPAPTDPERMTRIDEACYSRVIERLKALVGVIALDCGTGLQEPAARAAINAADQLVLVTDEQPAAASLVAEAAGLLARSGRPITLVVNKLPRRRAVLDVDLLARHIPFARGLVRVPRELRAASRLATGDFNWERAPVGWRVAIAELAAVLAADWGRLGLSLPG